jgi:hypothetical protein
VLPQSYKTKTKTRHGAKTNQIQLTMSHNSRVRYCGTKEPKPNTTPTRVRITFSMMYDSCVCCCWPAGTVYHKNKTRNRAKANHIELTPRRQASGFVTYAIRLAQSDAFLALLPARPDEVAHVFVERLDRFAVRGLGDCGL